MEKQYFRSYINVQLHSLSMSNNPIWLKDLILEIKSQKRVYLNWISSYKVEHDIIEKWYMARHVLNFNQVLLVQIVHKRGCGYWI